MKLTLLLLSVVVLFLATMKGVVSAGVRAAVDTELAEDDNDLDELLVLDEDSFDDETGGDEGESNGAASGRRILCCSVLPAR